MLSSKHLLKLYGTHSKSVSLLYKQFSSDRAIKVVKLNAFILFNTIPHKVLKITQGKRGKGGGFVRAKLKNLINQSVFEKTYTSDETVEEANYTKQVVQYSWQDGNELIFIDNTTFEEIKISKDLIEDDINFKEGEYVKILKCESTVIGIDIVNKSTEG